MEYIKKTVVDRVFFLSFMVMCAGPFQAKAGPFEDLKKLLTDLHGQITRAESDAAVPVLLNNFQTAPAVMAVLQQIPRTRTLVSGQLSQQVPGSEADCRCFPECSNPDHTDPLNAACPTPTCVPLGNNARACIAASCHVSANNVEFCTPDCCNKACCGLWMSCGLTEPLGYCFQALSLSAQAGRSVGACALNACNYLFPCWTYERRPVASFLNKGNMLKVLAALIAWCDEMIASIGSRPPAYQAVARNNQSDGGDGPSRGATLRASFMPGNVGSQ